MRDEASARLPALVGALAFGALMVPLCGEFLGTLAPAPVLAVWCAWSPYVVTYSQEARGYSWMLALQAALLVAASRLGRRPSSIILGSMLRGNRDRLLHERHQHGRRLAPARVPGAADRAAGLQAGRSAAFRRNVAVQALAIGLVGLVFLMDRLPYVYSSVRQYGIPASGAAERLGYAAGVAAYLFPTTAWKWFAALGLVGLALPGGPTRWRFVRVLAPLTFGIVLMHLFVGRLLPYRRLFGSLLPLFLLGAGNLARLALTVARPLPARIAASVVVIAATATLVAPWSKAPANEDRDLAALRRNAAWSVATGQTVRCLMVGQLEPDTLPLYQPASWQDKYDRVAPGRAWSC